MLAICPDHMYYSWGSDAGQEDRKNLRLLNRLDVLRVSASFNRESSRARQLLVWRVFERADDVMQLLAWGSFGLTALL